jgi:hypothetical protein
MVERPHSIRGARVRFPDDAVHYLAFGEKYQHTHSSMVERPHSIGGARVRFLDDAVQYLAFGEKYWDVMYTLCSSTSSQPSSTGT